ncbi:MAG: DNA polymerase III subunit gamma/tau [Candidatus Dormibacteria bacterium]
MSQVRQALYQKYRPSQFSELVGQEVVATTLRHAVRDQRLSHAYLFAGIRGTGKTSAARILAQAMNCESPKEGEPCAACEPCRITAEGRSLDMIEIDAATNRGIDEIRDLRERAQFLPSQFRTKVYIIDEAHMLTAEAGNAFLKTLEEPPEHARFILATTEPQRLTDTVLSRCQRFDFRRIPTGAMAEHLAWVCSQEGVKTTPEAMELLAEAGAGSLRDALSQLDRVLGLVDGELDRRAVELGLGIADPGAVGRLAAALGQGRAATAWDELHQLQQGGVDPRQLARSLGALARSAHWQQLSGRPLPGASAWSPPAAPPGFWLELMAEAAALGGQLRRADDPWMTLEAALLRLAPAPVPQPAEAAPGVGGSGLPAAVPSEEEPVAAAQDLEPGAEPVPAAPALARWTEILGWVGRENVPVQALLKSGRPASHAEGVLTIEFEPKFAFHFTQMQTPGNRQVLERACREVLGEELVVEVVQGLGSPDAAGPPAPAAGGSMLGKAMTVFPGSRVTRLGSGQGR